MASVKSWPKPTSGSNRWISDIMARSGRRIISAMIAGRAPPHKLADLAAGQADQGDTPRLSMLCMDGDGSIIASCSTLHLRQWTGCIRPAGRSIWRSTQRIDRMDESPRRRRVKKPFAP